MLLTFLVVLGGPRNSALLLLKKSELEEHKVWILGVETNREGEEDEMGFAVKDKERVVTAAAAEDEMIAAIFLNLGESFLFFFVLDFLDAKTFKIVLDYCNKKR